MQDLIPDPIPFGERESSRYEGVIGLILMIKSQSKRKKTRSGIKNYLNTKKIKLIGIRVIRIIGEFILREIMTK